MYFDFSRNTMKLLIKLYKNFIERPEKISISEYIEEKIVERHLEENQVNILYILLRHSEFFQNMVEEFWNVYSLKPSNRNLIVFLMYVILFEFEQTNLKTTIDFFNSCYDNYKMYYRIPMFFEREETVAIIGRTGCEIFDHEYVIENILNPIYGKYEALLDLISAIEGFVLRMTTKSIEVIMESKPPKCFLRERNKPKIAVEVVKVETIPKFEAVAPPKTTYEPDQVFEERLNQNRKRNREKALKLLEEAREKAWNCARVKQKTPDNPQERHVFRPRKPPKIKSGVQIKTNTTYFLRHAATLAKEQISEIRKIETLISGASNFNYDALESEIREAQQRQTIQDIERKHLQGLLTREEALLAKQNLLKQNQNKMEQYKIERAAILQEIETWKRLEETKIKTLVEKAHNITKAARESERQLLQKNQNNVKTIDEETRKLLQEAYEKKQNELAEKVRLIQELRALNQLSFLTQKEAKEFDPTVCPNFGLMCEMSIAELWERLTLMKIEMNERLEKRKKSIAESKKKQRDYLDGVKDFINETKQMKNEKVNTRTKQLKVEDTPEILLLKRKLETARSARNNLIKIR